MRLADSGRAIQQQPSLEVLTGVQQFAAVPGDQQDLPVDGSERVPVQHHLVLAQNRTAMKLQQRPTRPEHLAAETEHLSAEHVVPQGQLADLAGDALRLLRVRADDLDRG